MPGQPYWFSNPASLDLSIVIVSFNTRQILLDCIESIYAFTGDIEYEIFVVDNNSADGSADAIAGKFPGVVLIRNSENRGFSAANNQGMERARGRYVVLLNSDTRLVENCFLKIARFLDERPEFSIGTPQIVDTNGNVYPMRLWEDTPRDAARRILGMYTLAWDEARMKNKSTHEVEAIGGSCFVVRRSLFENTGLLDERYFLYNEEDDFCRRARRNGHKICYFSGASIIHLIGKSTHLPEIREKVIVETYRSNLRFYEKHYSPTWNFILRVLYKGIFLAGIGKCLLKGLTASLTDSADDSIVLKLKLLFMKV